MGTLLLVCLLPLDPAKRLFQLFTPKFENMKASLLLAPGNLTSQPTTPFIDTFLNLFSQYYKYSNSCQKPFPAASNHMLTGLKPISRLWERLPILFLILYRKLLHPGAAPVLPVVRTAGTRSIPTKVTLAVLGYQTVTSESGPQSLTPLT